MRRVMWTLACALALCGPAAAVPARAPDLSTTDAVLRWINGYRTKPDIAQVPVAVRTLSQLGALRDSETSAVYVGFVAGIIGSHPQKAGELIEKMLPIKAEDHWFIVRAVAYSGMPNWRDVLNRFASRMPTRQLMIEKYTSGKLPTLEALGVCGVGMPLTLRGGAAATRGFCRETWSSRSRAMARCIKTVGKVADAKCCTCASAPDPISYSMSCAMRCNGLG